MTAGYPLVKRRRPVKKRLVGEGRFTVFNAELFI
jgi:hypothetical protein